MRFSFLETPLCDCHLFTVKTNVYYCNNDKKLFRHKVLHTAILGFCCGMTVHVCKGPWQRKQKAGSSMTTTTVWSDILKHKSKWLQEMEPSRVTGHVCRNVPSIQPTDGCSCPGGAIVLFPTTIIRGGENANFKMKWERKQKVLDCNSVGFMFPAKRVCWCKVGVPAVIREETIHLKYFP